MTSLAQRDKDTARRKGFAAGAATAGSVALMLIWTLGFWEVWTTGSPGAMASPFWAAVFTACYAPLNLWGPALLVLTWAYRRRAKLAGPHRLDQKSTVVPNCVG